MDKSLLEQRQLPEGDADVFLYPDPINHVRAIPLQRLMAGPAFCQHETRLTIWELRLIIAYVMVKMRLQRVGAKNRPSYRVVVIDSRAPRDGAYIQRIGHYDPLTDPETVVIDKEPALKWLQQGAQPSQAVARLLSKLGISSQPQKAESGQST